MGWGFLSADELSQGERDGGRDEPELGLWFFLKDLSLVLHEVNFTTLPIFCFLEFEQRLLPFPFPLTLAC